MQHHVISAPPSCRITVHGGASSVRGALVHRHIHPGVVSLGIPWFGGSSPSTMGPCDRGNVPNPTTHHGPFGGTCARKSHHHGRFWEYIFGVHHHPHPPHARHVISAVGRATSTPHAAGHEVEMTPKSCRIWPPSMTPHGTIAACRNP